MSDSSPPLYNAKMTIRRLKEAGASLAEIAEGDAAAAERAREIVADVEKGGENAARRYAAELDKWSGDILVSAEQRKAAADKISPQLKDDIHFSLEQVRRFAHAQKDSMREMQTELHPGAIAGHKHIPLQTAGCYVPGGRYAHVASAIMSAATAKAAGVETVVACSPPHPAHGGIHPAILHALDVAGADYVLNVGGAHGIAALAFGLFSKRPADILVGPGNAFVASAKQFLAGRGRVAIDMFAGPTEILIIADDTADPDIVAADLVGQAEHGPNSPAWLIALSPAVAEETLKRIPAAIELLPPTNRESAARAWRDVGEISVAENREEAAAMADDYAAEHVEVQCADLDWWLSRLRNYGSLFLGEETTVAFGDKTSGPNHILPTKGAARRTGGLSVAKFMKTLTWQKMTRDAARQIGATTARISRAEGMEAHARTADIRLQKWFPDETFQLHPQEDSNSESARKGGK